MINLTQRPLSRKAIGWLLKWRHPFWWLPDVPSEQEEAYRRIWQHLRQVSSVTDGRHDTEDWRGKDGDFVMCCVRIPPEALFSSLDQVRETLQPFPFVRLHPPEFLHITVQELGFLTDEPRRRGDITQEWLDEFIGQSANPVGEFSPFAVALGGINSFVDAAFLDVHDDGWLSRIHGRLIDFVSIPPSTRYSYLPVATIAHYTRSAPVGNLVAALTPWRDQIFARFRVETVDIVKLRTGVPYPELEVIHQFELGHQQRLIGKIQGGATS